MQRNSITPANQPGAINLGSINPMKRLEYLKGKQATVGGIIKFIAIAAGGIWFIRHIDQINVFVDNLISLQEKLIYGAGLTVALWLIWKIVSSKMLQNTITMAIDRLVMKIHKAVIARDKFGSAEFGIMRLRKRKSEADESSASVYGVWQAVAKAVENARAEAEKALANAKAFDEEIARRSTGKPSKIKMSDEGLGRALASAKSTLRINIEFLKSQQQKLNVLGRRCDILRELSNVIAEKLEELELQLDREKENWELARKTMDAMQASDDVVEGTDTATIQEALSGIIQETDFFNGRVMMLMDRLDPTVQNYRVVQAGNQIADEECYQTFLNETKVSIKAQTQQLSASLPESSSIVENAELLLGNTTETPKERVESAKPSGEKPERFGGLLRKK